MPGNLDPGEPMLRIIALMLLLGCGQKNPTPDVQEASPDVSQEVTADVPAEAAEPENAEPAEAEAAADATPTPESLYEDCEGRVEGRQSEGECTTDADCKTGGCSQEVCTTNALAADLMTTCEARICFQVLDACGCNDGVCSWSLKDEIPPLGDPPVLPTTLPADDPPSGLGG